MQKNRNDATEKNTPAPYKTVPNSNSPPMPRALRYLPTRHVFERIDNGLQLLSSDHYGALAISHELHEEVFGEI